MYFYQEPELEPAPDKKFPEPPQNRPAQKPCSALTQIVPYLSSLYTVFHSVIFNSVAIIKGLLAIAPLLSLTPPPPPPGTY